MMLQDAPRATDETSSLIETTTRRVRVLLVKPYQRQPTLVYSPPFGILSLAATLKERFGDAIEVRVEDFKVIHAEPSEVIAILDEFQPDFLGVSALNCEAAAARELSDIAKRFSDDIVTVLGGPHALHRAEEILNRSSFDWIFNGAADYSFPEAVDRHQKGFDLGEDISGLSYRKKNGESHISTAQDNVKNLDELPMPEWDMVDLDLYASKPNFANVLKGKRYAMLFTSRGCPYLCNYCHDIFSKRFVYQSAENVLRQIEYLYEEKGVDEFQIIDDIFNLHKPRLKKIMSEVIRRWPGKLKFTFPNGVRADILDEECIELLARAGTYFVCIAIETATPRLQSFIEKELDIEKARWAIDEFNRNDVAVCGFFMLGFPTETEEELKSTARFALESDLTFAQFFTVVPQPETPLYPMAQKEGAEALDLVVADDEEGGSYRSAMSWYQRAYGFDLGSYMRWLNIRFYFHPKRIWRIWTRIPRKAILRPAIMFVKMLVPRAPDASHASELSVMRPE